MKMKPKNRVAAINWWTSLKGIDRYKYSLEHHPNRHHNLLTGREIEELYNKHLKK